MSSSASRAVRALCALAAAAIALISFVSFGARPQLGPEPASDVGTPEALAFVVPEAAAPLSDAEAPELLGLDAARAAVAKSEVTGFLPEHFGRAGSNPQVAAEIRDEALGAGADGPTPAAPAAEHDSGPHDHADGTDESASVVTTGPTAGDIANGDEEAADAIAADAGVPTVEVGGAIEAEDLSGPWPLPVPPAAPATLPKYEDPSVALVAASGRPFPEIADTAADALRGVSDEEIRVGGIVSQTLAGFPYRPEVCRGAQARFDQANQHDELSRTITFAACADDGGRADAATALAASLADDDIFAVVPVATDSFFAGESLTEAQRPHIGAGDLPAFCGRGTPMGFGVRGSAGCPVLEARGYTALAEPVLSALASAWRTPAADRAIAYLVEDGARGKATMASRAFEADLLGWAGVDFSAALPTPATGPVGRWSERIDTVIAGEPQVIIIEGRNVDGLPEALREAGFDGELVLVGRLDPLDVADPEFRRRLAPLTVVSPGVDVASRVSPGWASLAGAAAVRGLESDQIGLDYLDGYLAADFFVRAVAATPEPLTAASLANTVNAGWWYPGVDGVSCGSWWPAGHLLAAPCVSVARLELLSPRLVPVLGLVETEPQLRFGLG